MKKIIPIILASSIIIGACSTTNTNYQKNLKESIKLMNEMEYEKAISTLNKTLEKDLKNDQYEEKRTDIVNDLIDEARYMAEHIEELTKTYKTAIATYENFNKNNQEDITAFSKTYQTTSNAARAFNDMKQLDMYKELMEAEESLNKLATEKITTAQKDFDDGIKNSDFDKSEKAFNDLNVLLNELPSSIKEEYPNLIEELNGTLTEEKEKYALLPTKATKWAHEVVADDFGSIHILGARAVAEQYQVYVSLKDGYAKAKNELKLGPTIITASGDKTKPNDIDEMTYDDEVIMIYSFSNAEKPLEDLVRINFDAPIIKKDEIQLDFKADEKETIDIKGVLAITGTIEPNIKIENDDYSVQVQSIDLTKKRMKVTGSIDPKKDIKIRDHKYVFFPKTQYKHNSGSLNYSTKLELYQGTSKEFEFEFNLDTPITEFNNIADMRLFGQSIRIDLETGKEAKKEKSVFINDLLSLQNDTEAFLSNELDALLINQDKKIVDLDSIIFSRIYSLSEEYVLDKQYKTFKTTLHAHQKGKNYENVQIQFFKVVEGKEDVLLEDIRIKNKHKATDISLDLTGADRLKVKINVPFVSNHPFFIFEKPMVE